MKVKIKVNENDLMFNIHVTERIGDDSYVYQFDGGVVRRERLGKDAATPLFMKIPSEIGETLLQELANALHDMGIKAHSAAPLANELTAVRYHLEDMRKLVFKKGGE